MLDYKQRMIEGAVEDVEGSEELGSSPIIIIEAQQK